MDTLLKRHREALGLPLAKVAREVGVNRSTLYRIEAAEVAPSRQTARALFDFYQRAVPIAHIYDPEYAVLPSLSPD
jgi:DNA-binding XRE family transcriptional regulator